MYAFTIFWVLAVFPTVPFLPVGRTAGSLLGGMLMVIFQVITVDQAYDAIDLQILGLLFGTMVVTVYIEKPESDFYYCYIDLDFVKFILGVVVCLTNN